jgi:hypothetical protein
VTDLNFACLLEDKKLIHTAVLSAASNIGRSVYVKKQQAKIVLYLCKGDGCLFRARFRLKPQHWKLTGFNEEYTCIPASKVASKSQVLQPVIERALLLDPSMKPAAFQFYIESSLKVNVRRHMVIAVNRSSQHNSVDQEAMLVNRLPAIIQYLTLKDPEGHFVFQKDNNNNNNNYQFSKLFLFLDNQKPSLALVCAL